MVAYKEKMIRSSFLHLPGISESKEKKYWDQGILDWSDIESVFPIQPDLYVESTNPLLSALEASEEALASRDVYFFASRLPRREYYRIAASFPEQCVFLDIETTGLSRYYDKVTLVGWSVGDRYSALIEPKEIDKLMYDIREHPLVVTFNGALFDLPFLSECFDVDWSSVFHIDLRYSAKRVGLKGGQKQIETEIGLSRSSTLAGISGVEAVRLWFDYKEGDLEALRQLVQYNHADIEGMKYLLEEIVSRLSPRVVDRDPNRTIFDRSSIHYSDTDGSHTEQTVSILPYRGLVGPRLTLAHLCNDEPRLRDVTIVGIDLTGSVKRKSGWAAVRGEEILVDLFTSDDELIKETLAAEPFLVSIDSPLSLPAGRISAFDDDPGRNEYGIVREAERQLRRRGVHVYPALILYMQRLTQRGIELATRLRKCGIPVIESYPGAAQDILGIPRKKTSVDHLVKGLCRFGYTGLSGGAVISHDELDAATSALVGQFMLAGYWEALGSVDEDYLIVPMVDRRPSEYRPTVAVGISGPIAAGKTTAARFLEAQGFWYCRFSEIIEQQLRRSGALTTRANLQSLGQQTYNSRFGQRLLQHKLAASVERGQRIVIDGLRHPEDSAYLRERWGMAAFHIHIDAPAALRVKRYVATTGASEDAFSKAEMHAVEQNVDKMKGLAKVTISNSGSIGDMEVMMVRTINGRTQCP